MSAEFDLTRRDEFARAAMTALIVKSPFVPVWSGEGAELEIRRIKEKIMPGIAAAAYGYADAMLAERAKKP